MNEMPGISAAAQVPITFSDRRRFINRELSWLFFNMRVLDEACNPNHPLLERLRFLSISGNNLDEFFMVRVAGLKGQQLQLIEDRSPDGLTASEQLAAITAEAGALMAVQQRVWLTLCDELNDAGIEVLNEDQIDGDVAEWCEQHFRQQIFPVLTPQALDPAHPFPFIPNKGFTLLFDLKRLSDGEPTQELVMLPVTLKRFVRLPGSRARYV